MNTKRPQTIEEVALRSRSQMAFFDQHLAEFLDEFYLHSSDRQNRLQAEPEHLSAIADAYLAASAEYLADCYGLATPTWCYQPTRFLEMPHFSGGLENMKAMLLAESPLAFRRRMIFVSEDALDRASRFATEPSTP